MPELKNARDSVSGSLEFSILVRRPEQGVRYDRAQLFARGSVLYGYAQAARGEMSGIYQRSQSRTGLFDRYAPVGPSARIRRGCMSDTHARRPPGANVRYSCV